MNDDIESKLVRLAHAAAHTFRLGNFTNLHIVESLPEDDNCFGWYDDKTGELAIRTKSLKGKSLALSTVIDTLAHELAHIIYYQHDKNHRRLTMALKIWIIRNWDGS